MLGCPTEKCFCLTNRSVAACCKVTEGEGERERGREGEREGERERGREGERERSDSRRKRKKERKTID